MRIMRNKNNDHGLWVGVFSLSNTLSNRLRIMNIPRFIGSL